MEIKKNTPNAPTNENRLVQLITMGQVGKLHVPLIKDIKFSDDGLYAKFFS